MVRRVASISKAHEATSLPNPTRADRPRDSAGDQTLERHSSEGGEALVKEDLFLVLGAMGESLKDVRDRALLLIGFAEDFSARS